MLNAKTVVMILVVFTAILFVIDASISEPNEPECEHEFTYGCLVYGCDCYKTCNKCGEVVEPKTQLENVLDDIPTWPEYIELKRDLVIKDWVIEKGTKIYFKEED